MKNTKALVAALLVFTILLSFGNVFAFTLESNDLGGGYRGYNISNSNTVTEADGTLTVEQKPNKIYPNKIYSYPDSSNNLFTNSGFEKSTEVTPNTTTGFKEITSGWATYKTQDILDLELSNDAHSGEKALKMTVLSDNQTICNYYSENAIYNNLNAGEEYVFSVWVKGDSAPRFFYKKDANSLERTVIDGVNTNTWTLGTMVVTADTNGEIFLMGINLNATVPTGNAAGGYIIVDDIQLMKKSDAVEMVKQMIADLDVTSSNAARAIDDIEQWCAKLSLTETEEYAAFEAKKALYNELPKSEYNVEFTDNMFANSGFESSMSDWTLPTAYDTPSIITDDVHSGTSALKYTSVTTTSTESTVWNSAVETPKQVDDDTYIISAWVKGYSPRFFYRSAVDTSSYDSTNGTVSVTLKSPARYGTPDTYNVSYDDWTLITFAFEPVEVTVTTDEANGTKLTTYWVLPAITVNPPATDGAYTLIDDIAFMKKSQAISNVEAMIDRLDISSENSERATNDIEQWIAVLGKEKIANYDLFVMKKSGYAYYNKANSLTNAGFEKSDEANSFDGTGFSTELTTGWTTNWGDADLALYSISDDAHSGNNAISVEVAAGYNTRLFNTNNIKYNTEDDGTLDGRTSGLEKDTEYIISYWVKGTSQTCIWSRTVDSAGKQVDIVNSGYIEVENDYWTLGTNRITSNENGELWWCIYINNTSTVDSITAIIDDIQLVTVDEAVANVETLIEQFAKLDTSHPKYTRARNDIKLWLDVLDVPDLYVKYAAAVNGDNIITPNDGYTHLAEGDYIASVSLKGEGTVNRVYGDNFTNIEKVSTTLTEDFVTYTERVTVGAYGTHYTGVQLTDSADIGTVEIKDFSLERVGDVNGSGEINICDMVRMAESLSGAGSTVNTKVADYNNSSTFDYDDVLAIQNKLLNTDPLANILRGKTVSVLGDSITTYKGYTKNFYSNSTIANNRDYYNDSLYDLELSVDFTYWKQIINITETRLLVNNSWAGASIRNQGGATRGTQLHDDYGYYKGETPDIILVHYGTNDYLSEYDIEEFATNYNEMVTQIKKTYPDADIFLFTFPPYYPPDEEGQTRIARLLEFNAKIREVAENHGCPLVDLYNDSAFNFNTFKSLTFEGLHPNAEGMDAITDTIYKVMCEEYLK